MKKIRGLAELAERIVWRLRHKFRTEPPGKRPRLLVDVSTISRHDAQTGIQRVVRSIWSELQKRSGTDFDCVPIFATRRHGFCLAPPSFLEREPRRQELAPVEIRKGDRVLGLDLSAHLLPKYRDQLRAWKKGGASLHLVVYDLLPVTNPGWFNASTTANFRKWLEVLTSDADQAICISDHVAGELKKWVAGTAAEKTLSIGRMPMGSDIAQSLPTSGLSKDVQDLLASMRFRPTILMVGTVEPRKGHDVALAAFEYLWRTSPGQAPDLVIVGKSGWKTKKLQAAIRSHPMLGRRLHWLEGVSDEALCNCYEAARGLLIASRGEGFGLPLIEAAEHRLPVLARDLPVFREHDLPGVRFFTEDQPQALARQIIDLLDAPKTGGDANLISWQASVNALVRELGVTDPSRSRPGAKIRDAL